MSWFSLIQAEQSVLDSQQFFKNLLTGEFFGEYAVEKILKKKQSYQKVRSAVSNFFSCKLCKPLDSISTEVTQKLLERVVMGEKLPELFPELFDRFHGIAHAIQFKESIQSLTSSQDSEEEKDTSNMHQLVHHIFDQFLASDALAYKQWIEAMESGDDALKIFVKKAVFASLFPVCKKTIHSSFQILIKSGIENAVDNAFKTGISIITITSIYSLTKDLFDCTTNLCDDTPLNHTFEFMQSHMPSGTKTLWALTAIHIAEMVKVFWKARRLKLVNTDLNKDQVKALVNNMTKEPIKNALHETEIFKALNMTFKTEKIDAFVRILIDETIDYYWEDIHKIRFLNMPLVT